MIFPGDVVGGEEVSLSRSTIQFRWEHLRE